ncbi:AAA family ATPase [Paraburkholderia azotifigens]|uniref:AAA family ATPase n=1 Tax=Paraburkholderia azotifigens TaxID=2057004 RepID=UPI00316FE272
MKNTINKSHRGFGNRLGTAAMQFFRLIDFLLLQTLCAALMIVWLCDLWKDMASHNYLTASARGSFFVVGYSLAVLVWLSWNRYATGRRVGALIGITALLHVCMPLDRLTAITAAGGGITALALLAFSKRILLALDDNGSRRHREGSVLQKASQASELAGERVASQPSEPAYSFADLITNPRYSFSDVVGMDEVKQRLLAIGQEIINGTGKRNGILLVGEPGVGKTFLGEALAGELNIPFFALGYQDIASPWVNETPLKIKAAFAHARNSGAMVFMLDEIDSFCKPRTVAGNHHMDTDLCNSVLTEVTRLRGARVILLGCTNTIDMVDKAAVRQGRFDARIDIPPPDAPARHAILSRSVAAALGPDALPTEVLVKLVEFADGFSAARLAAVGEELADMRRNGIVANGPLTFDILKKGIRRLQGSGIRLPEKLKRIDEIIMPERSRHELVELAYRMKHTFELGRLGGRLPRGVLMYGPPGTGKTQSVLALAAATGAALFTVRGCDVLRDPSLWDKALADARDARPSILFVDEVDDLLRDRRESGIAPVTNKVLTAIDGTDGRTPDLLFIGATNHYACLDHASTRRFELKIAYDLPDDDALSSYVRIQIRLLAGETFAISRYVMDCLTGGLKGRSIADADAVMQAVIDAAALRRLRDGSDTVTTQDVQVALRRVLAHRW